MPPSLPRKLIHQQTQTNVALRVVELGGIHKYDLTPDVTHLIVGNYDTDKYRHVARERPDIKAMDADWIVAVAELWRNGEDDFDMDALESKHQLKPLERRGSMPESLTGDGSPRQGLLISLTGFGEARDAIAEKITSNGATYTPDLTKQCTHLIVCQPEGKKFTAAKQWGVHTVSAQWLDESIKRGLILEELKFDPQLPLEEQGRGAVVFKEPRRNPSGKRPRSGPAGPNQEGSGPRKLRKTASMKLNSQRDGLWGDILKRPDTVDTSGDAEAKANEAIPDETATGMPPSKVMVMPQHLSRSTGQGIFTNCIFYIHGFPNQRAHILQQTTSSLGGSTTSSIDTLGSWESAPPPSFRFVIVPQTSQPETHPTLPNDGIHIITEFYIEKCLHNKQFFDPRHHVIGRPFPVFPIPDLAPMTVCTAAFTGIELSQVARSVTQLGATFSEEFRPSVSVLVCRSLIATRKEKLKCALAWGVTVVSAEWLWECISTGCCVPLADFTFTELKKRRSLAVEDQQQLHSDSSGHRNKHDSSVSLPPTAPALATAKVVPAKATTVDCSGFDTDGINKQSRSVGRITKLDSTTSADFHTARTNLLQARDTDSTLTELSSAALNKSPSPTKHDAYAESLRTKSDPTPRQQENPATNRAPSAPPADIAQHIELEDDAARAQAAQHQTLLTSRLASLVDTSASIGSTSFHASADDLKPRRRQLLGRATSNVSATSSNANVTAAAIPSGGVDTFGVEHDTATASDAEGHAGDAQDHGHPGTQLAYGDPEAQGVKAQIISRMAGEATNGRTRDHKGGQATAVGGRALRKRE